MDVMEVQFIGGPQDGLSFAYTQDDLPFDRVRIEGREKYQLNTLQLKGWTKPRFVYLHTSLSILDLNLVEH